MIQKEEDILKVINEDEWMMNILKVVKSLDLPDWWICAGFVRSKIWDVIHNFNSRTSISDIDVIYFDSTKVDEFEEKKIEENLKGLIPNIPWSVKNQARMHVINNMSPYTSSIDAISKFPETVTALGVKLNENGDIELTAPWGITDVINFEVKPTPYFLRSNERIKTYEDRVTKKNWNLIWDKVKVCNISND